MANFTMRMPQDEYDALEAMSLLTGRSMAVLCREAIDETLTEFADENLVEELIELRVGKMRAAGAALIERRSRR